MSVPGTWYLLVAALMFCIGAVGLLVRRAAAAAAAQSAGGDRSTSSTGTAPRTSRWSS